MKKISFIILIIALFSFCELSLAQGNNKKDKDVESEVVFLRSVKQVEELGLIEISEVDAKVSKFYGPQSSLRKKARENIKKNAKKIGATHVLIEVNEFSTLPINNVYIQGVAYKKAE